MNNDCCDPGDIVKSILSTTKDVYNAGVDAGLIHGDRIGRKGGHRSLLFDDPDAYYQDQEQVGSIDIDAEVHLEFEDEYTDEYEIDCSDCHATWHKEIRQITQTACEEIKKMQSQGMLLKEMFWDAEMDHLNIIYENPKTGQWLKSDLNFEDLL